MHNQNQVQLTINHTGQVQLITEVQVQELHHDLTVRLHQVQATIEAARQYAVTVAVAVAEVTVAEAEVVVVRILADQAEVLLEAAAAVAADVLQEVVHHLPVADNY